MDIWEWERRDLEDGKPLRFRKTSEVKLDGTNFLH